MARRHFIISWHSYDNRAHILGARKHAPERHVAKYDYSSGLLISELDKLICFYLASDMFFPVPIRLPDVRVARRTIDAAG